MRVLTYRGAIGDLFRPDSFTRPDLIPWDGLTEAFPTGRAFYPSINIIHLSARYRLVPFREHVAWLTRRYLMLVYSSIYTHID
jgi:hypothetical protein